MLTRWVLLPNRTCTTPNSRKTRSAASSASHTREKARIRSLTVATECCFDASNQRLREQQVEGDWAEGGQARQGSSYFSYLIAPSSLRHGFLIWTLSHPSRSRSRCRLRYTPTSRFALVYIAQDHRLEPHFSGEQRRSPKTRQTTSFDSLLARHFGKPSLIPSPYDHAAKHRATSYTPTRPATRTDNLGPRLPAPCILNLTALLPASPLVTLLTSEQEPVETLPENCVLPFSHDRHEMGRNKRCTNLTDHVFLPSTGMRAICQRARVESLVLLDPHPPTSQRSNELVVILGDRHFRVARGGMAIVDNSYLGLSFKRWSR